MKKFLAILMVLLLVTFIAACGGEGPAPSPGENTEEKGNNNPQPSPEEVSITEEVVVDEKGVLIKVTALEESWLGPELKVYIENNSDVPITVQGRKTSVNGFMIEPVFSCDVAPGKKATDGLTFADSDMEKHKIEVITDIELVFHVFNANTWDTIFDSQLVRISTSAAETYAQTYDSAGEVLFDSAGIKIVFQGLSEDLFGPMANLYIENNTNQAITVQARDTSVNGFMMEPIFSCDIMPGKKALDDLTFFEDDLLENGIDAITEIELRFHIFDADSWDDILDTEVITITP